MSALVYLYCVLPADAQVEAGDLQGIEEGSRVALHAVGALKAAISDVGQDFAEASLNERIRDLDWLSPRAVRHHEVVDQLYTRCKLLLPLTFGAIFRSLESLTERLHAQQDELLDRLERLRAREQWDLKLTRDQDVFEARLADHSPALRDMEADVASKPPGTRFLLEKKLQNLQAREAQRIGAAVRGEVHETLAREAVEAQRDQLAAPAQPGSTRLELRSSYLIEEGAAAALQTAADGLASKLADLGYQLDVTGPWPAYSFAGGLREALA